MNKFKNFISKILERNSGNLLRYRVIYCAGAIIHTFFIILFAAVGFDKLIWFNIASVLMYAAGSVFIKNERNTGVWIILFYMEIVLHAVLCGLLLDYSYGFHLYSLMVIPVSYYMAYMDPNIKHGSRFATILAAINVLLITTTSFFKTQNDVIYNAALAKTISSFNFVVSTVITVIFCSIYTHEMHSAMKKLQEKNDELNFLANYDALTKLRNRHHIADVFHIYEQDTSPYCVFLGDIDDFKRINDTYSHDCGDKVLISVADIISKNVGDKGVVCRWGGEEILVILSGKNDECLELMEKTRLTIQNQRLSFDRKEIKVTMTFGFADYSEAMSIEKLVSIADKRLYVGKKSGKNRIVSQKDN